MKFIVLKFYLSNPFELKNDIHKISEIKLIDQRHRFTSAKNKDLLSENSIRKSAGQSWLSRPAYRSGQLRRR